MNRKENITKDEETNNTTRSQTNKQKNLKLVVDDVSNQQGNVIDHVGSPKAAFQMVLDQVIELYPLSQKSSAEENSRNDKPKSTVATQNESHERAQMSSNNPHTRYDNVVDVPRNRHNQKKSDLVNLRVKMMC